MAVLPEALALFDELLDLDRATQCEMLDARTRDKPELRAQVLRLWAADDTRDPLLDGQGPELLADLLVHDISHDVQPSGAPTQDAPIQIVDYRVLTQIGEGASGVVYEAEQASPKRRVAIKTLRNDRLSPAARQRVLDEAQALSNLRHPSVPFVIEAGEWSGGVFIAMELVNGSELGDALKTASHDEILRVFEVLCRGVDRVHQGGWLHRDLKPSNVLINADGMPKLIDFGMALSTGRQGGVGGTVNYVSPEQAAGAEGERRSDLYSLGAMLYEALVGRAPVECRGVSFVEAARLKRDPIDFAGLPTSLALVLERCLQPHAEDRYDTVGQLADDLARVRVNRPVRAGRSPWTTHVQLWHRRHAVLVRRLAVSAALVGAIVVGVVAWAQASSWQREADAIHSLGTLQQATDKLLEQGKPEQARATFEAWIDLPEYRGTRAVSLAWLQHRPLFEALDEGKHTALAQALATAPDVPSRQRALKALVADLRDEGSWHSLESALHALEASGATGDPADWGAAMVGQARLQAAADHLPDDGLAPVLRALSHHTVGSGALNAVQRGSDDLIWRMHWPQETASIAHLQAPFKALGEWPTGDVRTESPVGVQWNGQPYLIRNVGGDHELLAYKPGQPIRSVHAKLPGPLFAVTTADLDGDGSDELYWGTGAYTRTVYVLDSPTSEPRIAIAANNSAMSDIKDLVAADLDGDGRQELVVSHSTWRAYDVRVYHRIDDELVPIASTPHEGYLVRIPHPEGGHSVAVYRAPSKREDAVEPGLWLYRLHGTELRLQAHVPLSPGMGGTPQGAIAGDFDGDGLVDIALNVTRHDRDRVWMLRQTKTNTFEGAVLEDWTSIAALDVDRDGDDELFAKPTGGSARILGMGEEIVAPSPQPHNTAPPRHNPRAAELVQLGLIGEASDYLLSRARIEPDLSVRRDLWVASAGLLHRTGHVHEAIGRLKLALQLPIDGQQDLLDQAARWSMEAHDFDGALQLLLAMTAPDPELLARAKAAERRLTVDWTEPMWSWSTPSAAKSTPTTLTLDVYGNEPEVVRRAFNGDPNRLGFEVDIDLHRSNVASR